MKEKKKFVLRVQEIVRDSSGFACGFKNERIIEFEVEDYPDSIQFKAFSTAVSLLGVDVVAGVANRSLDVCMLEFGVCGVPLLTFSLRVYPSGGVHWVYDVPGWFVDIDGNVNVINSDSDCDQEQCGDMSEVNTDVSEQADSDCCIDASELNTDVPEQADLDCGIAEEIADKCEDASELNTDVSESEECEYASEEDLAHLFGYDLPSTDFCDYGDNGFYIV